MRMRIPMAVQVISIPVFPWDSHSHWESHSHAHLYPVGTPASFPRKRVGGAPGDVLAMEREK